MAQLTLDFACRDDQIQLDKTVFRLSNSEEFIAVRGKTSGAYAFIGSFQWTPAVKAVCILFLQARARGHGNQPSLPTISGKRGSLAASLDYAIDKEPQWMCDMFGLDGSGKTNLRRFVYRSNTGSKRPGPISISLNEAALPTENVTILVDSLPLSDLAFLEKLIAAIGGDQLRPLTEATSIDSPILRDRLTA